MLMTPRTSTHPTGRTSDDRSLTGSWIKGVRVPPHNLQRRGVGSRSRFLPRLETLEDRFVPGETAVGLLAALLGTTLIDPFALTLSLVNDGSIQPVPDRQAQTPQSIAPPLLNPGLDLALWPGPFNEPDQPDGATAATSSLVQGNEQTESAYDQMTLITNALLSPLGGTEHRRTRCGSCPGVDRRGSSRALGRRRGPRRVGARGSFATGRLRGRGAGNVSECDPGWRDGSGSSRVESRRLSRVRAGRYCVRCRR